MVGKTSRACRVIGTLAYEQPLGVPPGEQASVYVSSPLWVRIETGKPAKLLCELPTFRPSDTWFGPNTISE